jgi:hypothetical protein
MTIGKLAYRVLRAFVSDDLLHVFLFALSPASGAINLCALKKAVDGRLWLS